MMHEGELQLEDSNLDFFFVLNASRIVHLLEMSKNGLKSTWSIIVMYSLCIVFPFNYIYFCCETFLGDVCS